jgi:PAS domain-containing protein
MNAHDFLFALLLPVPPWLGFLIYRYRGRVGIAYGYFLGGILALLALPWPQMGYDLPSPHLGGALLGFTLFIAAHRDGGKGLRRLAYGVGGATVFVWLTGSRMGLDMRSVFAFWAMAVLDAGLWLLLSDLGYRVTQGRWLSVRMPVTGGLAFLIATDIFRNLPLGAQPLSWGASFLAGILLGLVALQQFLWLRKQGIWVEGRGDGFRVAMSALEGNKPAEGPTLAYAIEARQPMFLVNEKGMLLETNTAFSRMVGFPRNQIRGYLLQDLFQGRDAPAWDDLKDKLLRDFKGSVQATLVRKDSSFQNVRLEAVAFDRNMALVWIADPAVGTLALRSEMDAALQTPVLGVREAGRMAEKALGTILPAVEQILQETWNAKTRDAAERIMVAAQRLMPEADQQRSSSAFPHLQAAPAMEALLPRLQRMLPAGFTVRHRTPEFTLFMEPDALQRIATQLVLHGRQGLAQGTVTLAMAPLTLGNRSWALLTLELAGRPSAWEGDFLGLTWLQDTVRASLGILEMAHDGQGFLWPRIFLPCESLEANPASRYLQGRSVWIIDHDPQVREVLCGLVRSAGGEVQAHPGLRPFLESARRSTLPDILVLERAGPLGRFQTRLRRLGGPRVPAILLLGDGRPWSQGDGSNREGGSSRIILLEKPFPGQNFLQCLLALLHSMPGLCLGMEWGSLRGDEERATRAGGPPSVKPDPNPSEPPCPPSP